MRGTAIVIVIVIVIVIATTAMGVVTGNTATAATTTMRAVTRIDRGPAAQTEATLGIECTVAMAAARRAMRTEPRVGSARTVVTAAALHATAIAHQPQPSTVMAAVGVPLRRV